MLPRIYHTAMGTGPASPYLQTRYRMSNVRQPHRVLFIFLFLFLFLFWRAARFQKRAHLRLGFGNLARVWFERGYLVTSHEQRKSAESRIRAREKR